jgi:hypothetical protein
VVDVFEEVDEHLRADRAEVLLKKYLPWVLGGLAVGLAVALAVWGFQSYSEKNIERASTVYAQGIDSLGKGDAAGALKQFGDAAKASSGAYKSLSLQQVAGIDLDQGKTALATKAFDDAAKASGEPILADAARLKSAYAVLDTASYADIEARLKPILDPKRPYSPLAREALAWAKLRDGKIAEARSDFVVLSLLPSAPDNLHQRAHAAIGLIDGGTAGQVAATVKEAVAMPSNPLFPQIAPAGGPAPNAPAQSPAPQPGPAQ